MTVDQFNRLPLLLRQNLVQRLLGMGKGKVNELVRLGHLKVSRVGRETRYHRESVRALAGLERNGKP